MVGRCSAENKQLSLSVQYPVSFIAEKRNGFYDSYGVAEHIKLGALVDVRQRLMLGWYGTRRSP
jgi:hypothetical protein